VTLWPERRREQPREGRCRTDRGSEPETGSLADGLRGEEGLEYLLCDVRAHARAGVLHLDANVATGGGEVKVEGHRHIHVSRADAQVAAADHRIAGVAHQIDEHLQQLCRVADRVPRVGSYTRVNADRLGQGLTAERLGVGNEAVRVDVDAASLDAAGECEHLPHHVGTALGAALDDPESRELVWVGLIRGEQLHRHEQRGENVVEIVRDTAG
jgi:hypothetical protein